MGAEKGFPFLKKVMNFYENRNFITPNGNLDTTTLPTVLARNLRDEKIDVLPMEFFSPKNTRTLELRITKNTYSIHHFNGSWHSVAQQKHVSLRTSLCRLFGENLGELLTTVVAVFINLRYEGVSYTLNKICSKMFK
jgi:hypothetical protein